jgi:hypothetical protein
MINKRPSSEEWHITVGPRFIVNVFCEFIFVGIYSHILNGNKLVQFRGGL